jgi:hypothetical protein
MSFSGTGQASVPVRSDVVCSKVECDVPSRLIDLKNRIAA